MAQMLERLRQPLDAEQRASLAILVAARWFLAAIAVFTVNYRPTARPTVILAINLMIAGAAALNIVIQRRLRRGQPVPLGLPVAASVYDAAGITIAIALVDGFINESFVLYYPALLAISVVFPGRWSALYALASAAAYLCVSLPTHDSFQAGSPGDQRVLALRLAAMAATVLIANLVVRIERDRRERAVAAEAARAAEVQALEERARAAERAAEEERHRLSRDVHDGIAQQVYMLTLGLETIAALVAEDHTDERVTGRVEALVRLAKQTLLDTRNLLFDLGDVMTGETGLDTLIRNQACEFAATTGIAVDVRVCGAERRLSAIAVSEVYRVVQEGLANVYKHAQATSVVLRLCYGNNAVTVTIGDDGRGFEPAAVGGRGHGLSNMQARAARLGGRLAVASSVGAGTTLTVVVPHEEPADGADPCPAG
jgi:signal transduction histidine kinase